MIELTREDVEKIYDELDRRIGKTFDEVTYTLDEYREILVERLQGVYGTMMAIVPNKNWRDIVQWISAIEEERYHEVL